ncbi:MAG: arsenate reductase ArsC [Candidatus Micrarchaeota archaeon]
MKRVLFICVGNAARSQIAEGWFNHLANEKASAESAGSKPAGSVSSKAIRVMGEAGIDISSHTSKALTLDAIERADYIITMGCHEACPATNKPVQDWGLPDPIGKDIKSYRELRDRIKKKVQGLIASMG